ncbi:MAG: hypothetical protein HW410_1671 [Nitrosarchaeum sp.]|nr:hypothetical protein [Nitrosarchaeum sp.]
MNINNDGRIIATTSLLLLVASMTFSSAFAEQSSVMAAGNVATIKDITPGICGDIDLVFIVDTTGSMGGAIGNIVSNLGTITAQANLADADGNANLGLVTFKDEVTVVSPLTSTQGPVLTAISGLTASVGGNLPEASDEAKNTVVNNLSARTGQTGDFNDAPPGGFDDTLDAGDILALSTTHPTTAAGLGIHISDVFVPTAGDYSGQAAMLQSDANTSGGIYLESAADGSDVGQIISNIIAECGGNTPSTVAGELLSINSTSLFISGLFTNSFWMLPIMAGIAGTGAFVIRSRMHKD